MATAVLSIDIEARIAKLESGLRDASSKVKDFSQSTKDGADRAAAGFDKLNVAAGDRLRGQFGRVADSSKRSALEMQQLGYQLNDFFVQIASGQSPLTAFIQQGSQLSGTFGGVGGALKAVLSVFTPFTLALGGAAAVIGTLAYSWYKGVQESDRFNKAVALTGNYAGVTEGQYTAMAVSIAQATQTHVGAARDILAGLIATGEFSGKALESVATAATTFGTRHGKAAEDVVSDFARMGDGAVKWALEHNKQYHFLTAAQVEYIRKLEEQGNAEQAYIVVSNALVAHNEKHAENVGFLVARYRQLADNLDYIKEKILDIGKTAPIEDQIAKLRKSLAEPLETSATQGFGTSTLSGTTSSAMAQRAAQQAKLNDLLAKQQKDADDARANAASGAREKELGANNEYFRKLEEQTRTNADRRAKEIKEINDKADRTLALGDAFSAERRAKLIAAVNAKYKDPKGQKADDPTKALLANQLKDLEHQAGEEREILSARNKMLDLYFGENLISIRDYYEGRRTASELALTALNEIYDKEIAALEAQKGRRTKASEREEDQGKINDLLDKKRKLAQAAAEEGTVGAFKEGAAYRGLAKEIEAVDAALEQMRGKGQSEAAALAKFDKEYADLLMRLKTGPENTAGESKVNELRQRTSAQAQFNDALSASSNLYQKLGFEEDRIALSRQIGAISELDALRLTGAARREKLAQIEREVQANERLAESYPDNEDFAIKAEQARLELEKLAASADVLGDKFRTMFSDNLSGPLTDFIDGTKTAKEAFKSFANSILHEINSMAAKNISESIFGKGTAGGGVAGGIAGLFGGGSMGSVIDKISGWFGGGTAEAGARAEGGGLAGAADDMFSMFAGTAPAAPVNSTGFLSTILGSLGGLKKGDAPSNPMYVKSVDILSAVGASGVSGLIPGSSSGGSLIETGAKLAASYFGSSGGATGATSFAGGAESVAAENFFSMFAGAATGGDVTPGWIMVGEKGRELIRENGAGAVIGTVSGTSADRISEQIVMKESNRAEGKGAALARGWQMVGENGPEIIRIKSAAHVYDDVETQKIVTAAERYMGMPIGERGGDSNTTNSSISNATSTTNIDRSVRSATNIGATTNISRIANIAGTASRRTEGPSERTKELFTPSSAGASQNIVARIPAKAMPELEKKYREDSKGTGAERRKIDKLIGEIQFAKVTPIRGDTAAAPFAPNQPIKSGTAEAILKRFAGAATGGDTTSGWFMAGEKGRELIRTNGARVYNNRDTERLLTAGQPKASETVVHNNYNITVEPPAGTDRRTALQWGDAFGQQIRASSRNS